MKVRIDFVTNSSSASYLLTFKTPGWSREEVLDELHSQYKYPQGVGIPYYIAEKGEKAVKQYQKNLKEQVEKARFIIDHFLTEKENGIFEMYESTTMHNSFTDGIPTYLQEFIFNILTKKGWEVISLEMTDTA